MESTARFVGRALMIWGSAGVLLTVLMTLPLIGPQPRTLLAQAGLLVVILGTGFFFYRKGRPKRNRKPNAYL